MDDSAIAVTPERSLNLLTQEAIKAALEARWEDALRLNTQIINIETKNIDALNRIARAHFELGDLVQADKYYKATLDIDPYNPIAQKNIKLIQTFKKSGIRQTRTVNKDSNGHILSISPSLFLNEPGKTKIVNLLKVAEPQKLSLAYCGMQLEMSIKNRGIYILDTEGRYLGVLPDDLSYQLIRLIKGGNQYAAYVKAVKVNGLTVLVREMFRSKKFKNQPSFLDTSTRSSSEIITNFNRDSDDSSEEASDTEENPAV